MFSNAESPMRSFKYPKQVFIMMMPVRFYCITAGSGPCRSAAVVIIQPTPTLTHSTATWPQGKLHAPVCAIVKTLHHDFSTVSRVSQGYSMVIVVATKHQSQSASKYLPNSLKPLVIRACWAFIPSQSTVCV